MPKFDDGVNGRVPVGWDDMDEVPLEEVFVEKPDAPVGCDANPEAPKGAPGVVVDTAEKPVGWAFSAPLVLLERKLEPNDDVPKVEPGVAVCCGWIADEGVVLEGGGLEALLPGIESSNEAPKDEEGLKGLRPANPVGCDVREPVLLEWEETEVAPVGWLERALENKDEPEDAFEGVTVCWGWRG